MKNQKTNQVAGGDWCPMPFSNLIDSNTGEVVHLKGEVFGASQYETFVGACIAGADFGKRFKAAAACK